MPFKVISSVLIVLFYVIGIATPVSYAMHAGPLQANDTLPAIHVEGMGLHGLIDKIATSSNFPIGLITHYESGPQRLQKLDFAGGSVQQLIQQIISSYPNLRWHALKSGGAFYETSPTLQTIAQTYVPISTTKAMTRQELWTTIIESPAYIAALHSVGCTSLNLTGGTEWNNDKATIQFGRSNNLTLEELLASAAEMSGLQRWSITQSSLGGGCSISLKLW